MKLAHKNNFKKRPEIRTTDPRISRTVTCLLAPVFLVHVDRDWYVPIRTDRRLESLVEKTKTEPTAGRRRREHGRGRPRHIHKRRTRWGASSEHHAEWWTSSRARAFTAQKSKSDFSIAETTWPTYLYIYLLANIANKIYVNVNINIHIHTDINVNIYIIVKVQENRQRGCVVFRVKLYTTRILRKANNKRSNIWTHVLDEIDRRCKYFHPPFLVKAVSYDSHHQHTTASRVKRPGSLSPPKSRRRYHP